MAYAGKQPQLTVELTGFLPEGPLECQAVECVLGFREKRKPATTIPVSAGSVRTRVGVPAFDL